MVCHLLSEEPLGENSFLVRLRHGSGGGGGGEESIAMFWTCEDA